MVFFRRRGKPNQKKLVTKSIDLLISHVVEQTDISSNSSSAVTYPILQSHNNTGTPSGGYIYSSGSTITGIIAYGFDGLNLIPDDAQNIRGEFLARVKMEDPSKSESKFQAALYLYKSNGARRMSGIVGWGSTESLVMGSSCVISDNLPSYMTEIEAARALALCVDVGYYGGMLQGATLTITYDIYE